jgi:hypothetical protein
MFFDGIKVSVSIGRGFCLGGRRGGGGGWGGGWGGGGLAWVRLFIMHLVIMSSLFSHMIMKVWLMRQQHLEKLN